MATVLHSWTAQCVLTVVAECLRDTSGTCTVRVFVCIGISHACPVFGECCPPLLSVMIAAVQAKRMHVSMCIKATMSKDPGASPSLELLDRIMSICTDQGRDSPSMRAICQALPGRSLGSYFPCLVPECLCLFL